MKYLFSVQTLTNGNKDLYSVEALDVNEAEKLFAKAFCPLVNMSFNEICDSLESFDIVIDCIGTLDKITEL